VSDASGSLRTTIVAKDSAINEDLLKSDDIYILDTGSDIFVWVGKGASKDEKKNALSIAMKYLVDNKRDPCTHITRVLEGGGNKEFQQRMKQ
jgi:hypothetical protein